MCYSPCGNLTVVIPMKELISFLRNPKIYYLVNKSLSAHNILIKYMYDKYNYNKRRSQWPRGLRRRSAVARLLRSWVRIPPGAWMFVVSVVCCQVEVSATS